MFLNIKLSNCTVKSQLITFIKILKFHPKSLDCLFKIYPQQESMKITSIYQLDMKS